MLLTENPTQLVIWVVLLFDLNESRPILAKNLCVR